MMNALSGANVKSLPNLNLFAAAEPVFWFWNTMSLAPTLAITSTCPSMLADAMPVMLLDASVFNRRTAAVVIPAGA
jgi:hypothetical protein